MEIIKNKNFYYIWQNRIFNFYGCDKCELKKIKIDCPKDCKPDCGCYRIMTQHEVNSMMLYDRCKNLPMFKNIKHNNNKEEKEVLEIIENEFINKLNQYRNILINNGDMVAVEELEKIFDIWK